MPLHSEYSFCRIHIHRLHYTIGAICAHLEPGRNFAHRLVMRTIHLYLAFAQYFVENIILIDGHHVARALTVYSLMNYLLPALRREVLIKRASEAYIDNLATSTDAKHRNIAIGSQAQHCQLHLIAHIVDRSKLFDGFLAEIFGVDVFATGKQHAVEMRHHLCQIFSRTIGGYHYRHSTCSQHGIDIGLRHRGGCASGGRNAYQRRTFGRYFHCIYALIKLCQLIALGRWRGICTHYYHSHYS